MRGIPTGPLRIKSGIWIGDKIVLTFWSETHHGLAMVYNKGNFLAPLCYTEPGMCDGPLEEARFDHPSGLCQGLEQSFLVADMRNHRIRKVENQQVSTLLGKKEPGNDDGPIERATLTNPKLIAATKSHLVITQESSSVLRVFSFETGQLHTLALPESIPAEIWPPPALTYWRSGQLAVILQQRAYCLRVLSEGESENNGTPPRLEIELDPTYSGIKVASIRDTSGNTTIAITPPEGEEEDFRIRTWDGQKKKVRTEMLPGSVGPPHLASYLVSLDGSQLLMIGHSGNLHHTMLNNHRKAPSEEREYDSEPGPRTMPLLNASSSEPPPTTSRLGAYQPPLAPMRPDLTPAPPPDDHSFMDPSNFG